MLPAALQSLKGRNGLAAARQVQLSLSCVCISTSSEVNAASSSRQDSNSTASTSGYDQYSYLNHFNTKFSIKPSPLSPLFGAHRENLENIKKQEYVQRLITAHKLLSTQYIRDEGESADEAAEQRIKQLVYCTKALAALTKYETAPAYQDRDKMYGYYAMLDKLAAAHDPDFQDFSKVLSGSADVWEYWIKNFQERYSGLPSLEPLEDIYQKPDPDAEAAWLRKQALKQIQEQQADKAPRQPQIDAQGRARGVGRRKTSTAVVYIFPGEGRVLVNQQPVDQYFCDIMTRSHVFKPFLMTSTVGKFDVAARVTGGGISGQAQAVAHAISRALKAYDPSMRTELRRLGLTKRDPRMVERKKPGRAKARKSFTWVKR